MEPGLLSRSATASAVGRHRNGEVEHVHRPALPDSTLHHAVCVQGAAACALLYHSGLLPAIDFMSPNEEECVAMAAAIHGASALSHTDAATAAGPLPDAQVAAAATALVQAGCKHVLVTRGARGLLLARAGGGGETVELEEVAALPATVVTTRGAGGVVHAPRVTPAVPRPHLPCPRLPHAHFISGSHLTSLSHERERWHRVAGDAFVSGTAWGLMQHPRAAAREVEAVRSALRSGLRAAQLTVESEAAVAPTLAAERLR